jgi:hypothetical protein
MAVTGDDRMPLNRSVRPAAHCQAGASGQWVGWPVPSPWWTKRKQWVLVSVNALASWDAGSTGLPPGWISVVRSELL